MFALLVRFLLEKSLGLRVRHWTFGLLVLTGHGIGRVWMRTSHNTKGQTIEAFGLGRWDHDNAL